MYSSVIILLCLFLFHAIVADSTMDLLKLSTSNQVLVLNSQIKDLKVLVEHQNTQFAELKTLVEHQNTQFAKENAKLAKVETTVGKLESEIAKLTFSQVTTTKPLPTTTTTTTTTVPLTTSATTLPPATAMPLSVSIKNQALLLHIKDQDIKIAELKALVEHQNVKFANVETKMYKMESEYKMLTHFQAATTSSPQTSSSSTTDTSLGVVFTRWGRTDCPAGISTPVYNGTVGGSHTGHTGAAVNHLCMPHDPTWDVNKWYKPTSNGYVYSGSYSYLPDSSLSGVAPCAVCRAESFSTKVMIPGRDRCYPGWTRAYNGELVSGRHSDTAATEYACLDKQPQKGVSSGSIRLYFYSVLAKCGLPYQDGALLTCVVCLK